MIKNRAVSIDNINDCNKSKKERKKYASDNDENKTKEYKVGNMSTKKLSFSGNHVNSFVDHKNKARSVLNVKDESIYSRGIQDNNRTNIKLEKVYNNRCKDNIHHDNGDLYIKKEDNVKYNKNTSSMHEKTESETNNCNKNDRQERKSNINIENKNGHFKNIDYFNKKKAFECDVKGNIDKINNNTEYLKKKYWKNRVKLVDNKVRASTCEQKSDGIMNNKLSYDDNRKLSLSAEDVNEYTCHVFKINNYIDENKDDNNKISLSNNLIVNNILNWMKERQSIAIKWLIKNGKYHYINENKLEYNRFDYANKFPKNKNDWRIRNRKNKSNYSSNNDNYFKDNILSNDTDTAAIRKNSHSYYYKRLYNSNNTSSYGYNTKNKYYKKDKNSKTNTSKNKDNITQDYLDCQQTNGPLHLYNKKHKQKQRIVRNTN